VLAVAMCVLLSNIVCVPLNWWMIRRIDPGVAIARRLVKVQTALELVSFSFWTLLNNAGQLLRDSTDSIVIGRVLNAALITPFTVASRLVDYFRPIITSMVSPMLPRMSQLDGQGRHEEIRQLFLQMTRLSALASLAIGSLLVLHGRTLLLLWVGPRYVSSYPVLVLLVVGAVASTAQFGTQPTLMARGRHRAYGIWTIGEGVANLVLSIVWAHWYGIVGVALGTAVPLLVVKLTLQPWYVTKSLGLSLREYFGRALARPLAVAGLFFGLCYITNGLQAKDNFWHLVGTLSWEGLALIFLVCIIGFNRSDRQMIGARLPLVASFLPPFRVMSANLQIRANGVQEAVDKPVDAEGPDGTRHGK
jgi:O-antigen/teichoic acid export membrane protein